MCFALWCTSSTAHFRLVLAFNRDEDLPRPSSPAHFWPHEPRVLAGVDLDPTKPPYGTWLAVAHTRVAFLTNFRLVDRVPSTTLTGRGMYRLLLPAVFRSQLWISGQLVPGFVCGTSTPAEYATHVFSTRDSYNGFNLVAIDASTAAPQCAYASNHEDEPWLDMPDGVYALSNTTLRDTTPYPKVKVRISLRSLMHPSA